MISKYSIRTKVAEEYWCPITQGPEQRRKPSTRRVFTTNKTKRISATVSQRDPNTPITIENYFLFISWQELIITLEHGKRSSIEIQYQKAQSDQQLFVDHKKTIRIGD